MSIKNQVERHLQTNQEIPPAVMSENPAAAKERLILRCQNLLSHIYAFKLHLHPANVCSPLQETLSVQNTHAYCLSRQIWSLSSTRTVPDFICNLLLIWNHSESESKRGIWIGIVQIQSMATPTHYPTLHTVNGPSLQSFNCNVYTHTQKKDSTA